MFNYLKNFWTVFFKEVPFYFPISSLGEFRLFLILSTFRYLIMVLTFISLMSNDGELFIIWPLGLWISVFVTCCLFKTSIHFWKLSCLIVFCLFVRVLYVRWYNSVASCMYCKDLPLCSLPVLPFCLLMNRSHWL